MSQVVLKAKNRANNGKGEARKVRRAGRIPAVIYGHSGKAVSIDMDAKEFAGGIKGISESTIVKVDVEGKSFDAFVKDTQRNIQNGSILHVDFYEVESGVHLRAKVTIHLNGNPQGVREGGVLEFPLHEIEVECLPKDLPERIDLDISGLGANQSIHVRDLQLAEGVRVITGSEQVIALVKFAKEESAASTAEAAAAPTAEAAAAPAAAAPAKDAKEKDSK
jgi:large subunit ribosomal protein L25